MPADGWVVRGDKTIGEGSSNPNLADRHEAEMAEDASHFGQRHLESGQAFDLAQREIDDAVLAEGVTDDDILRRRAAAELHDELGRELQPRHHEGRIDAALEPVARVRIDAELAAGLRDVDLVPQRRFDQHVGGVLVATGRLAAHAVALAALGVHHFAGGSHLEALFSA